MEDIRARIEEEVGSWEGVSVQPHRFGGVEFVLGRRELGHLHPTWADLPFTRRIREMLLETGRAEPHRAGVNGWVSHPLDEDAIELFRLSYERARVAQSRQQLRESVRADIPARDDDADPAAAD
jgi:Ni,Fe-hydrogenase I large subunit